jgi:DNA adenine methylase
MAKGKHCRDLPGQLLLPFKLGGGDHPVGVATALAGNAAKRATAGVNVVFGGHDFDFDLVGFTAGEIRFGLRDLLNVAPDARAYLNGMPVAHEAVVRSGDRLEFMRQSGNKAGAPSPLRYPGGKGRRAPRHAILSKRSPVIKEYREPFVGSASLALRVDEYCQPLPQVWINDIDPHLVAFLTAVQDEPQELMALCLSFPHYKVGEPSNAHKDGKIRDLYARAIYDETLHPALRYFICNRVGWNGRVNYARPSRMGCWTPANWNAKAIGKIGIAAPYMAGWRITCQDYRNVLLAPGDGVWCILDAPYYCNSLFSPSAQLYRHNFEVEQHDQLAAAVANCGHRVLLTYDNCEAIRRLYSTHAGYHHFEEGWTYCGASGDKKRIGKELIITNYRVA